MAKNMQYWKDRFNASEAASPFTKKEDYTPQSQKGKYYKMKMDTKTKKIKLKKSKIQPGDYEPQTIKYKNKK
tara:strand:+ start:917 stop:1132 length:216 start_codon:yes stop_codon:yes gene_type:complete